MTHNEIAARARAPYAAKILELTAERDALVAALLQIARLSNEGEVSAKMQFALGDIARAALAKLDR